MKWYTREMTAKPKVMEALKRSWESHGKSWTFKSSKQCEPCLTTMHYSLYVFSGSSEGYMSARGLKKSLSFGGSLFEMPLSLINSSNP